MGNYQDYLKKQPLPLRELESAPVRQHMFGNPFKTNKNLMMMTDEVSGLGGVDEVQIVNAGGGQSPSVGPGGLPPMGRGLKRPAEQLLAAPPKRRKGPLPRDFQLRSPRESPAYRSELDYVPNLTPEMSPVGNLPLVNGLKTIGSSAGKTADSPIEIDLESDEFGSDTEGLMTPRDEPATGKVNNANSKPAEMGQLPTQPARNHFNKNNNKTDFLRFDGSFKPGTKETTTACLQELSALPPAESHALFPAPLLPESQPAQPHVASWQQSNGQPEYQQQQQPAPTPFQPRHRLESPNAFAKDVIGEILNLPPADLTPYLPPPPPSSEDSGPEIVAAVDQPPARRSKKVIPAPVRAADAPPAVAVKPPPAPLDIAAVIDVDDAVTEEELRSFRLRNNNVRQLIYKEVKRPGRCHVQLWKMLEGLHGPPWVRKQFIYEVKQEALRLVCSSSYCRPMVLKS
jgi:hypothetical protein